TAWDWQWTSTRFIIHMSGQIKREFSAVHRKEAGLIWTEAGNSRIRLKRAIPAYGFLPDMASCGAGIGLAAKITSIFRPREVDESKQEENRMFDVIALGELLIDFTQNGLSEQGNGLFEANPGGAPCNVLSMLNNLGKKTSFIGKVGNDQFGLTLKHSLEDLGIGTENLLMDDQVHTTLALVHTFENGDRDFSFYRNPGADMMLRADELNEELLQDTRLFHFGTLSMTHEGVREATKKA